MEQVSELTIDDYIALDLTHEYHTSERKSFRACRRRWDWLFREQLYPQVTAKPLEFGSAYHKAMEVWYNPSTWSWERSQIERLTVKTFVDMCESQKKAALELRGQYQLDADVEQDYQERVDLGIGMLEYYTQQVSPVLDIGWKPVKVEISFKVPVSNPDHNADSAIIWCKCDKCWKKWTTWKKVPANNGSSWYGLPVVYAGRIDMIAEDIHGNYWIFDWKTAASIARDHAFLYLDDQVASYVWALTKIGFPIKGFVYHEQRKGFPGQPLKNASRRLGRIFSVNKQQDTDYDTYLQTVMLEDTDAYFAGLYDDMLQFLANNGVEYFQRTVIAKTARELELIEKNIGEEILDMLDPKLRTYPNPGRFGCNFCAFQTPCIEKSSGGDYQYSLATMFEKKEPYYVRAEQGASTESKGGE